MDYMFLKNDPAITKGNFTPILALHDSESSAIFAVMICRKGRVKHVATRVAEFIGNLGYEKFVLKSNKQEPAIVDLQAQVKSIK